MADNKNTQAADVNEQIKIRMDKLKALQDAGKDPFQITKYDVTHHTDEIRAIYEAHEKELLGDRPAVNTEGLDEQQAREAVNADYNERRAIMDASPIEVSFAGRMMFKRVMGKASFCNIADLKGKMQAYISRMQSAKKHMQTSRSLILVIFSVLRDLFSELRQARFLFMLKNLRFFQRAFRYFLRSSTVLLTLI